MITDTELTRRLDEISLALSDVSMQQDKILDKIIKIVRNTTREQLLSRDPRVLITCVLRILFQYEDLLHAERLCEWKRRRRFRLARNCYHALLTSYLPKKSHEVVQTIVTTIYRDRLWEFETFCFEITCSLLDVGTTNGGSIINLIINLIWEKLTSPELDVEEARGVLRLLYELLDLHEWPATQETVATIEKILNLFQMSIINAQSVKLNFLLPTPPPSLAKLRKSLEVCLRNTIKHLPNDQLLIVVQRMCAWSVIADITDEIILEFGSILEYAAYTHQAGLFEQTFTTVIFPLLMQMIGSSSRLINLLGNRVLQYLLDRRDNRAIFDTPKIFFEHTRVYVRIGACRKEDRLFFKLHREVLHDSLLKSLLNHCDSRMNLETTYCTVCLIAVEVPCGFTAAAIVCLAMNLQEVILQRQNDQLEVACHVHATIISIMSLLCWIHKAKVFYNYVNRIIMERAQWAPQLNPPIQSQYNFAVHHVLCNKSELFFVDWEARYGLWKCFRLADGHDGTSLIA
ncbi:hypothetical protein DMN91_010893 [Ooceraea biroi]|uniref:Uncharacterized protein n=1 Tax=Ooceraea biroi TaxID=2015173 RepID=A0A3L8D8K3_OOCBI|nr:uncharacterized protein LOC113562925 [Ooceraea biroi]RLU16825.1 hypothetical protein DMN91_010893 [Ooceraea biroi]